MPPSHLELVWLALEVGPHSGPDSYPLHACVCVCVFMFMFWCEGQWADTCGPVVLAEGKAQQDVVI